MSLISYKVPTASEKIKDSNLALLMQMQQSAKNVFNLFWNNPDSSPQAVCDEFGTDAALAFDAHAKLQELIAMIDPTWVPLIPSHSYTKNEDGTVTIRE